MLNAESVGANNVKGPGPANTPSREQASIAVLSVVWSAELETISDTVLLDILFTIMEPSIP